MPVLAIADGGGTGMPVLATAVKLLMPTALTSTRSTRTHTTNHLRIRTPHVSFTYRGRLYASWCRQGENLCTMCLIGTHSPPWFLGQNLDSIVARRIRKSFD
jgi:hypothetical protein